MNKKELVGFLRSSKQGLFSERDTAEEACQYFTEVTDNNGEALIALMVYHNTLIDEIINYIEAKS